jgi:hypothetical protein
MALLDGIVHKTMVLEMNVAIVTLLLPTMHDRCSVFAKPCPMMVTLNPPVNTPLVGEMLIIFGEAKYENCTLLEDSKSAPFDDTETPTVPSVDCSGATQRSDIVVTKEAGTTTFPNRHARVGDGRKPPAECTTTPFPPPMLPTDGTMLTSCTV